MVGELSAQFYGGTDPNQTIAFAQMMGGIAAAAAGLGAEGVAIAANTGANAAQNNYMAHYDTYEKDLKACQQNPGGVNCGAILSLTEGTNAHYLSMAQGGYRVAANRGKDGADSSYTVVSPDGETMVMQPTEWAYFSQMTSGQQATIFAGSQWQLDLTSATEYGLAGNTTAAMANYAHMLAQPDYWIGMGMALLPSTVFLGGASKTAIEGEGVDFYVNSNGAMLPATGYRYMDSRYAAQTVATKSAPLSYFGFKDYSTAAEALDGYQIDPIQFNNNARLKGTFDTLQLFGVNGFVNAKVPLENGGIGPGLEPYTSSYPMLGKGGQAQLVPAKPNTKINLKSVEILPKK